VDLVHLTLNDLHYYHYGPSGPPYYLSSYLTLSEHFPWPELWANIFIFADFFGEEKRGPRHSRHFQYIYVKKLQKRVVYLSSSQKKTQVEKKNHPKRSSEGQDIEVLKSAIFRVFSADGGAICFYFCSSWRKNFSKQVTDLSSSHNFTQFQKKKSAGTESGK
jgi:hypothetical protein